LLLWEQSGLIEMAVASSHSRIKGFKVLAVPAAAESSSGIFG
jgi:hypothetical protein